MKAKINGIEVEGTPEEILDFNLKMEKHIDQLVLDMKKYTPHPSPSISQSKYISVPIHKPTIIMDVDYTREQSKITIKDLIKGTIQTAIFTETDNPNCVDMFNYIVYSALIKNVDQIHIETDGMGKGVYDHLIKSPFKDKVFGFKHERFQ